MKQQLERFFRSQEVLLGCAALLVGLSAGSGVWLFKRLIDVARWAFFDQLGGWLNPLGSWTVFLLPVLGGALVGFLLDRFVGVERHHGVAGIMEAAALAGGRLRYKRVPVKAAAAAISIGCGASVGPEDPSVQIGSNLGSMFGQLFHLSEEQVRALVAAGAAAGIAAAFNAPIAGVFFALEIIVGEIGGSVLGVVVVTAVISSVLTQAISGVQPAFAVPTYSFHSAWELPLYLGLGLAAGPLSALYVRLLYLAQDLFQKIQIPRWGRAALAGGIVGMVGIFLPQIFGVGYETIEGILGGKIFPLGLLLLLCAAKTILTPVCIGGGFAGGVFAPSMFLGATLGAAYGWLAQILFPGLNILPPAFAMVGMAAVLAGAVHAPLTAILLLFEMTHDYRIILPLMFAVVVSLLVSRRLEPESAYTLGLLRKGIRLERGRDVDVLERVKVQEVMHIDPLILHTTNTLEQAADVFFQTRRHGALVLDESEKLAGVFTLQDLDRSDPEKWKMQTVGNVCTRRLTVTYPDENIGAALRKMSASNVGRLPVVFRENPTQLAGVLRREDLVQAYDTALIRRASLRHRAEQTLLDASTPEDVKVLDIIIPPGAPCAGKQMKEMTWPRDSLVASLRRGRRVMIPRGDTLLKAGDVLVVVAEENVWPDIQRLCQPEEKPPSGAGLNPG